MIKELSVEQENQLARAFLKMPAYSSEAGLYELAGGKENLSDSVKRELDRHLMARLNMFRENHASWLNSIHNLNGANVLEIGAGTGSSTVALSELGAIVHAIDNQPAPLEVAKIRCAIHGITTVKFDVGDAVRIENLGRSYDMVIFFASFEHLTISERDLALKQAWKALTKGGCLVIIECPNRLWYKDTHTSMMNFYHWLPDDLAIRYAKYSPREGFNADFEGKDKDERNIKFARWGRGASYHELELAFGPICELNVKESLTDFKRKQNQRLDTYWEKSLDPDVQYRKLLMKFAPNIPIQFFYPWLDVVIIK